MPLTPLWSDPVLLDRYLAGEATPDESQAIEHQLVAHPEERRMLDAVRAGVADPYGPVPLYDADTRVAAIIDYSIRAVRRMRRESAVTRGSSGFRMFVRSNTGRLGQRTLRMGISQRHSVRPRVWSSVITLLCIGTVAIAGWSIGMHRLVFREAPSSLTYTTGNGERATIVLPDGGTVALNVASRLDVPMDYISGHRTVRLVGEGLFTVSHHAGAPLTVVAGGTTTRVLGTSFVVRHYPTDTAALVAVRDGKVAVGSTVVTAHQVAEVGRRGSPWVRPADGTEFTFATGILSIDGLPFPQAIVELDRWYDADIRLGDPALAKRSLEGPFGAGSLGELAEILELTYDVRVERDGRVLTLYPNR